MSPYLIDWLLAGLLFAAVFYGLWCHFFEKRCLHCGRPSHLSPLGQSCPTGDGDDFHEFAR